LSSARRFSASASSTHGQSLASTAPDQRRRVLGAPEPGPGDDRVEVLAEYVVDSGAASAPAR
jgi:hypothetical protein